MHKPKLLVKPLVILAIFAVGAAVIGRALTANASLRSTTAPQVNAVIQPCDIKWGPAPDVFPAGMQMAVLGGDPFKDGLFTVRAKMPASYRIMPHWHPTEEDVTVLEGTLYMGLGADFEESRAVAVGPG